MIKFILNKKVICSYSTFIDIQEIIETKKLLAYENNVNINKIIVEMEEKQC